MKFNLGLWQVFAFSIIILTFVAGVKGTSHGGLNFTQKEHLLLDIPKIVLAKRKTIGYEMATACPAQSPEEKEFNLKYSLDKKSLFVRNVFKAEQNPDSVIDTCADIYEMSVVYYRQTGKFKFGYEIYYDSSKFDGFTNSNYGDFDSIKNAYSWRRRWAHKFGLSKTKLTLKTATSPPVPLNFLWITQSELDFSNRVTLAKSVSYIMTKSMETEAECMNFNLGDEFYSKKNIDVDLLYRNQAKVFENVEIPKSDLDCEMKKQCLTRWSLITPDRFRFGSPEPTSVPCSNLASVAIWKTVANDVLRKLEKFLKALTMIVDAEVKIISGVHGQLAMPVKNSNETKKISLGEKGEIPVPNIIYKVVTYEHTDEEKFLATARGQAKIILPKSIILTVHNDPYFNAEKALCPIGNCKEWGWGQILSSAGPASNHIYCCKNTKEMARKLGMVYDDNNIKDEFNLTEFPRYDKESERIEVESIEIEIMSKMQEKVEKVAPIEMQSPFVMRKSKREKKSDLNTIKEDEGDELS